MNTRKIFYNLRKQTIIVSVSTISTVLLLIFSLLIWPGCSSTTSKQEALPVPPKAEKIQKELTLHNHTRVDNYYWLNQRDNPKVIAYLKAENDYLDTVMKHTGKLREKLYNEMVGRIKQDESTVPHKYNGYYYYTRFEQEKEYPIFCRKKETLENPEEITLNGNEMATGLAFFHSPGPTISPDNTMIAYGVDTVGRRKYTIHFKNLVSGEVFPEEIPDTTGVAEWANDNQTVFYTAKDNALREYKIFSHRLGTPVTQDKEIYHESDPTFSTSIIKSKSDKYLFIVNYHTLSTEYRYLDANRPQDPFTVFEPRQKDHIYSLEHFKDKFYIRTNLNAKNFKLMDTPIDKTTKENWQEVIPHREDVLLERDEIFKDFLVLQERKNGLTRLRVIKWDTREAYDIDFNDEAYVTYISINPGFDTDLLRFGYTSLTTPKSIYDYNMKTKTRILLKQDEILGDFDSADYKSERLFATSPDGTAVPISLVYRKGLQKNGDNPLLLYGYGSYGYSMDPAFNPDLLSLLDRGFVYAIAHIRGGEEMGRYWYEEGKLLKKKNTFIDFIACAEHLVAEKWTNPGKLFALGGSAGGLLMGAVVNMKPSLFKGIIAAVPFVDAVTTMLDESIPLTTVEYDEWGNPNQKEYYDYILSYSPYDNVTARDYPAMLVLTGLHDSQVQYWEPAKWVAKLRELKTDKNLLLLHTNMDAGHGGSSGRFRRLKERALTFAFILDQLGISE